MLWGFGLLYGTPLKGYVYLNRYQFQPDWLPWAVLHGPIWRPDMIPSGQVPPSLRNPVDLTVTAIRHIADYEEGVLSRCGLEYRRAILHEWEQPFEPPLPQELPQAWRTLADAIDA